MSGYSPFITETVSPNSYTLISSENVGVINNYLEFILDPFINTVRHAKLLQK